MLPFKYAGKWRKRVNFLIVVFLVLWLLPLLGSIATFAGANADWRTAPRHSIGIAPDPQITTQAVVQVYSARAFSWRGAFGVHTWIAVKRSDAARFTVYEVVGWRAYHGGSALVSSVRPPDGLWFGNRPAIIADIRGEGVDEIIIADRIRRSRLSLRPRVSTVARSQQQYLHGVHRTNGSGTSIGFTADGDREGLFAWGRVGRKHAKRHGLSSIGFGFGGPRRRHRGGARGKFLGADLWCRH